MGEEFCSQAHAREHFGVVARAAEASHTSSGRTASDPALDPALSRTGRHRVMRLLNLAPIEAPPNEPAVSPEAVLPLIETQPPHTSVPPELPVVEAQVEPPLFRAEPPLFSKIRKVKFPRRGCAPAPAAIQADNAGPIRFSWPETLYPWLDVPADAPLALSREALDAPGGCFVLAMAGPAAATGKIPTLWELQAFVPFAAEGEEPRPELPAGPSIASPEPRRSKTNRLFRVAGKERMRAWNLSTYRAVHKEGLEPWILPPRPSVPRWVGEPVKFDWARLVARLADFEQPIAAAPVPQALNPAATSQTQPSMMVGAASTGLRKVPAIPYIGPLVHFWQTQSWLSRSLALAIPLLAFIALKPSFDGSLSEPVVLAKDMPAPSATAIRRNPTRERRVIETKLPPTTQMPAATSTPELPEAKVEPKLNEVDRLLLSRAAVELADDFSFGLDSWDSRNGTAWTYDQTGFIRPRSLALYRPSMSLTDYSVQFLGKIDSAAIGWVVRAVDFNNYHAVKLVQRGGGPLPRYTIVRYSVVDGKEGPRIEHPLPLNLYKDTLFRIRMDIRGSDYAILVQDSVVDSWSDERFPFGGVGFFSGRGEESRIRWVQVTYQNDLIGKICAWFAPRV